MQRQSATPDRFVIRAEGRAEKIAAQRGDERRCVGRK